MAAAKGSAWVFRSRRTPEKEEIPPSKKRFPTDTWLGWSVQGWMVDGSARISAVNRSGFVSMLLEVLGEAEYISQENIVQTRHDRERLLSRSKYRRR